MRKEKEEKRNPQEPKPLISTPEVTWSTARAGGPCRAPNPGVMSRWNRDRVHTRVKFESVFYDTKPVRGRWARDCAQKDMGCVLKDVVVVLV